VNSTARTLIVACLTFASALVGFLVQRLLPVQYLTDAKGMVGSITGLVILLLALVLGLLVWTSYGVYTTQNTESQALGPTILQLDFALERYGPEARSQCANTGRSPMARGRRQIDPLLSFPFSPVRA
jgi:hypothetical protein